MLSLRSSTYAPASNRFRSRRLSTVAAAGTGCAVLSVAQAQIIYSGVKNSQFTQAPSFDLDGDSVTDLHVANKAVNGVGFNHTDGSQTAQVVLTGSVLDKLAAGEVISSASTWSAIAGSTIGAGAVPFAGSDWGTPGASNTGYFGFSFITGGSTYYGWGQVTYSAATNGTLIDWAYNSVAGEGIAAGQLVSAIPEPATTAMLMSAMALSGAGWWKLRRRARIATPNPAE
jgi:hypothetical protein